MIWPFNGPKLNLGGLKRLDDMNMADFESNPVWVTDLSGEDASDHDETSQRPVTNCSNVTEDMLSTYVDVSAAININGTEFRGSANVEQDITLSCIVIWQDGEWVSPITISAFPEPAEIRVVPTISQESRVFRHVPGTDKAV